MYFSVKGKVSGAKWSQERVVSFEVGLPPRIFFLFFFSSSSSSSSSSSFFTGADFSTVCTDMNTVPSLSLF